MTLQTLNREKDIMHTKTLHHREKIRDCSDNLNSQDIQGAQPRIWAAKETNRPDFHHTFDVQGAGPRMLHFELNKPEFNLTNDDIKGSHPCVNQFKSTRTDKPSNPLNPEYKLQSFDYVKPEPNKFVRDSMVIDDIAGTRSK